MLIKKHSNGMEKENSVKMLKKTMLDADRKIA